MKKPIRLGIIGPCPPPHGGVTRLISNNLQYWDPGEVESFLIPIRIPEKPQPIAGSSFIDYCQYESRDTLPLSMFFRFFAAFPVSRPELFKQFYAYNCVLSKIITDYKIDLLYSHHTDVTGLSGVLQSRLHGIPCVVVSYGQTWLVTRTDRRFKRMAEYVLKNASWIISTSEHCREGGLRLGADPGRYSVVYAGIDLDKFRPDLDGVAYRASLNIPPEAVMISILGLALRQKIDVFLDAIGMIGNRPDVFFLIGGVGEDFQYIQDRIKTMDLHNAKILGFVPEKDLPSFYAATDIMVASPKTMTECMGQSIKEAMACSRPTVVANIGGGPEAVAHMENGLLFEAGSPIDLKSALEKLIREPALRKSMGENALSTAAQRFNAIDSARKTLEIFRNLLGQNRAS